MTEGKALNGLQTIHKDEIAKIYGVSPQTVLGWVSAGKFPKPLPGGKYLWSVRAIEQFMVLSSLPEAEVKKARTLAGFEAFAP